MSDYKAISDSRLNGVIRAELARKQRTQHGLAVHLRMSQTAISRRMDGKISWRICELRSVASFLGLSLGELIDPSADSKASA